MKQQPIDDLERAFLNVLVSAVHWVARLKTDDRVPTAAFEFGTRLDRRETHRIVSRRKHPNRAADQNVFALEERGDARMFFVFGAVNFSSLAQLVVLEYVFDLDDAAKLALAVIERRPATYAGRLLAGDGQNHGNAPRQPIRQAHPRNDVLVVLASHEADQRTKSAVADQCQIVQLAAGKREAAKSFGLFTQVEFGLRGADGSIDQLAAVRSDHTAALTPADTYPRLSSSERIFDTLSSTDSRSLSTTTSGFSGAS